MCFTLNPGQSGCDDCALCMPVTTENKHRRFSAARPRGKRCGECHAKAVQAPSICMLSTAEPPGCPKKRAFSVYPAHRVDDSSFGLDLPPLFSYFIACAAFAGERIPAISQRLFSGRRSQVAKAEVCKTSIPGSNPGVASK